MSILSRMPTWKKLFDELQALESGPEVTSRRVHKVTWPGLGAYWLTDPQHRVVTVLAEALAESASPEVHQAALIAASGQQASRLATVFAGSSAWGTLIVPGSQPGCYRLAGLPDTI